MGVKVGAGAGITPTMFTSYVKYRGKCNIINTQQTIKGLLIFWVLEATITPVNPSCDKQLMPILVAINSKSSLFKNLLIFIYQFKYSGLAMKYYN